MSASAASPAASVAPSRMRSPSQSRTRRPLRSCSVAATALTARTVTRAAADSGCRYRTVTGPHTAFQPTSEPGRATLEAHTDAKRRGETLEAHANLRCGRGSSPPARSRWPVSRAQARRRTRLHGRRQHVRRPARRAVDGALPERRRQLLRHRQRRGHRADHRPHGRLRRQRRADDARPVLAPATGCVQIPWAFSATSIPYNVSGVGYGLKLTGPVLANIYLGHIKKWNDKRIKSINKGVNLPDEDIVPIYRSDGSGTSYNFTDYLSRVSKEWKSRIGKSTQPAFPAGVGATGSSGVAAKLQTHAGRHHLRRHRVRLQVPLQGREDAGIGPAGSSCRAARPCRRSQNT